MMNLGKLSLLRDILIPSGLFMEGTENFSSEFPVNTYYGFNVSKTEREPIDQIHGFIAASRIQERNGMYGERGAFYPFIAGVFEVLNSRNEDERERIIEINTRKDRKKKSIFQRIMSQYSLQGEVLLTEDLWKDERYWEIFAEVIEEHRFTKGSLIEDSLKWYTSRDELLSVATVNDVAPGLMVLPQKLQKYIGSWPASIIYTPIEVAEAFFMKEVKNVKCKIGHMEERVYDKYIMPIMDVIHLRQPVDLKSRRLRPRGVTPYIDKERRDRKIRIYFDDSPQSIEERLRDYTVEEYIYTLHNEIGELLNPIIDKLVLAVESAHAMNKTSIDILGNRYQNGGDVISGFATKELTIEGIIKLFPEIVYEYLIKAFDMNAENSECL
jgi:hypothetical protein